MTFDAAAAKALFAAVTSHALSLGLFARVNQHEPEHAPGTKLSCSITLGPVRPDPERSGLNAVTGTITFAVRVYSPMNQRPLDGIDPEVLGAVSVLLAEYSGAFTLGGLVRNVDLFALSAQPAYLQQEGKEFRVEEIMLPIVVNDLWGMSP